MTPALPAGLTPLWAGGPGIEAAARALDGAGLDAVAWSNEPGATYGPHSHAYEKLLVCAEGSITFFVGPDEVPVDLTPGTGFVLPAGTRHRADVGPDGCTCLEGHRG